MAKKVRQLSNQEIAAFCEQLSFIVKAGITLQEGLVMMAEDLKGGEGAVLLGQLLEHVEMGQPLAYALRESGVFPDYMVNMVQIGEAAGRLEEVLDALAAYYQHSEALSRAIHSSITYPLVMIAVMVAVILVIIIEVLPVFQEVFAQLGGEVSAFVQGMMDFGATVSRYSAWIIGALVALVLAFLILRSFPKGRGALSALYAAIFRKTNDTLSSGRFASAMALMLSSGMDVDECLDMATDLIEDERVRRKIAAAREQVAAGEGFANAIVSAGLFAGLYGKMVTIGFQTGALDGVMHKIAARYEEETDRRLGALIAALEPTLVAILSIIVGMILLSVMLPLLGVMSAIG
ncbi:MULTISPECIES: type II secretion system F family protein [unclassified Clostridium]|uniref:type II secretion system F family protein n=1 Tax=unclassified Clostridium TaxID=2614128 RepID=UPI00148532DE|nr:MULTISPECIES: type II secretion system F family protein [unclassified Clostridium]